MLKCTVVRTNSGLGHTYFNLMYGDTPIQRYTCKHKAEDKCNSLNKEFGL